MRFDWKDRRNRGRRVVVYLDGRRQRGVIWVDLNRGMLERVVFDEEGRLRLAPGGQSVLTEVVAGVVRVAFPEPIGSP